MMSVFCLMNMMVASCVHLLQGDVLHHGSTQIHAHIDKLKRSFNPSGCLSEAGPWLYILASHQPF